MSRKSVCGLLIITILLQIFAVSVFASETENIKVFIDDNEIVFDSKPVIENGRVLVPIRSFAEGLGLTVEWESDLKCVIIKSKPGETEKLITIFPDESYAKIGSDVVSLDVPAKIIDDRVFVPLRFIVEITGAEVAWDENTQTVKITSALKVPLLEGKQADTQFSILNDRFFIKAPKESVYVSMNHGGIMGSSSDATSETSIILDDHEQDFIVYARELFKYSTGNLLDDAKLYLNEQKTSFSLSDVVTQGNLQYVVFTPEKVVPSHAMLLSGALVKLPDNTLVVMEIYVNEAAFLYNDNCEKMAYDIFNSISPGTRLLEKESRTINLYNQSVEIADDYVYTVYIGPDFDVTYFSKLVTIGQNSPSWGMYSGGYPSKLGSELPVHEAKEDTIANQSVTWDIYSNKKGEIDNDTFLETIVGESNSEGFIHIFITPISKEELIVIEKMVHSIKIV